MSEYNIDIQQLLGLSPISEQLSSWLTALAARILKPHATVPEVKSYPDVVYFNYYALGLSLLFKPVNGYKPKTGLIRADLRDGHLVLDGIDIFNVPKPTTTPGASGSKSKPSHSTYPVSPFTLTLSSSLSGDEARPSSFEVEPVTKGKDFVEGLGEPDRKGGGAGPSSGSIGIWCEWSKHGLMVEFGGDESRGPQAWERGKDALWKVITIFPPKTE